MEDLSKTPTTLSLQEWKEAAEQLYAGNYPGVDKKVKFGEAKQYLGIPNFDGDLRTPTSAGKGKVNLKKAATRAAAKARQATKRTGSIQKQTVGEDVYGKGVVTPKGSGLEEHHKRVVSVYEPFFEGLNEKETKELAQWFVDEKFPLGNVKENLEALTKPEHGQIHNWMKQNFIQSETNKPLMSFKGMSLNERFPAVVMYLENVQPAVDEQLQAIISKRPNNPLAQTAVTSSIFQKAQKLAPTAARVGAIAGAAAPILDVGGAIASTSESITSQDVPTKVASGIEAAGGYLGAASAFAPVLAPAAVGVSAVGALAKRRSDQLKQTANISRLYGAALAETPQIIPTQPEKELTEYQQRRKARTGRY